MEQKSRSKRRTCDLKNEIYKIIHILNIIKFRVLVNYRSYLEKFSGYMHVAASNVWVPPPQCHNLIATPHSVQKKSSRLGQQVNSNNHLPPLHSSTPKIHLIPHICAILHFTVYIYHISNMKILTLNFLTCAVKACKSSSACFPLHPKDAELVQDESIELNPKLLVNILPRLDWEALKIVCTEVCSLFSLHLSLSNIPSLCGTTNLCRHGSYFTYYIFPYLWWRLAKCVIEN
jgi:hypothetical protein